MRHPFATEALATMKRALAEEPQPDGAMPFTEFIPLGCWTTSNALRFMIVHRVDFAVAVWFGDFPVFGAKTLCGQKMTDADLHEEVPEDPSILRICDDCLLHEDKRLPTVYRCFDAEGALLYVGCTNVFLTRLFQQSTPSTRKPWWPRVVSITRETFPTMAEALVAERLAIQTEHPEFNITHKRLVAA